MALLSEEQVKLLAHVPGVSRKDKIMLLLATFDGPATPSDLRTKATATGLREVLKWNISDVLGACVGLVIRIDTGWELHASGREHIRSLASTANINLVVTNASNSLRKYLSKVPSSQTRAFVDESITCLEAHQYRAAVVFSWIGAMSLLYDAVHAQHLVAFNALATSRDAKWKPAKSTDDLTKMKEHDFLDLIEAVGVIGRNVKQTLQNHCLQLRNSCGHPNSLQIAENTAAAHIEKLILNVFTKL